MSTLHPSQRLPTRPLWALCCLNCLGPLLGISLPCSNLQWEETYCEQAVPCIVRMWRVSVFESAASGQRADMTNKGHSVIDHPFLLELLSGNLILISMFQSTPSCQTWLNWGKHKPAHPDCDLSNSGHRIVAEIVSVIWLPQQTGILLSIKYCGKSTGPMPSVPCYHWRNWIQFWCKPHSLELLHAATF